MSTDTPVISSPKEFNLTKRFAVLSFACIALLTIALSFIASHYLTEEMLDREWETTAKFIRTETRQGVTSQDFKTQDFGAVAQKFETLHQQITMLPDIARIKVYNAQGIIIWSDEKRLIGTRFADNEELQEALEGKVEADISPGEKEENVFERDISKRLVEVYVPIFSDNNREVIGVIETYKSANVLFQDIRRARLAIVLGALGGGLFLYFSLFVIVRQASRRIHEQQKNLLKMQSELIGSQRMAAMGEMAAAVAHGIGNPLSSIRAAAQLTKLECAEHNDCDQSVKTQSALTNIIQQVDRMDKRMRGLLDFAKPMEPRPAAMELNSLLRDVVEVLQSRFDEAGVHAELRLEPNLPKARVDINHVEEIFMGLVTNALEATPQGGTVTIRTELSTANGQARSIDVSVEDTGTGIPAENRERIFEPFFTTKSQGTGIGLALAKKFVENNGGTITVSDSTAGGSRFEVSFPLPGGN